MGEKGQFNQSGLVLGSINTLKEICQRMTSPLKACFPVLRYRGLKGTVLFVLHFCNQLVTKLDDRSCTGKRNLALLLEIVREFCTVRFYIVGSEEFR